MPARAVSTVAATGATIAPMGRRVGSEPVSTTGRAMLAIVATSQTIRVAAVSPVQIALRAALPRSLPIPQMNAPVAIRPQNQLPRAATGRC